MLLAAWLVLYTVFKGKMTKALGLQIKKLLHQKLNDARDWVQLDGKDNWFFGGVLGAIGDALDSIVKFFQELVSIPAFPRPVPEIGWLGVVAVLAWVTYAVAGLRSTLLVTGTLLFFGVADQWSNSMDLLIITLLSVVICILIGLPIGIWMARSKAASGVITPVLDVMQTFPPFCYLAPLALFFGIGPACAMVLTIIYALPPVVRITEHGIRSVSPTTIEAARSLGLTKQQMLRQVQLPMARRTIVVGINQCTMAALSMATIAALVNGPGTGKVVVSALQTLNVGVASVAALCIVLTAIMLDRTTTAASERGQGHSNVGSASGMGVMLTGVVLERLPRWATEDAGLRPKAAARERRPAAGFLLAVLFVPVAIFVFLSRQQLNLAVFPDVSDTPVLKWISGPPARQGDRQLHRLAGWGAIDTYTIWIKDHISDVVHRPAAGACSSDSPWWLMASGCCSPWPTCWAAGSRTAYTLACEVIIYFHRRLERHHGDARDDADRDGHYHARRRRARRGHGPRPQGRGRDHQTVPGRVPGHPALRVPRPCSGPVRCRSVHRDHRGDGLLVPIATKLVADGVRGVSPTTVEAVRSTGSTRWQMISKVELPMARASPAPATDQGLLYALSTGPCHRRLGSAAAASGTSSSPASRRTSCSARASRRASPLRRSGVMSTG